MKPTTKAMLAVLGLMMEGWELHRQDFWDHVSWWFTRKSPYRQAMKNAHARTMRGLEVRGLIVPNTGLLEGNYRITAKGRKALGR